MSASLQSLAARRFESRRARTGVVGLGYVGLPLAVEFASAGFRHDRHRPRRSGRSTRSTQGSSYIPDVADRRRRRRCATAGKLDATTDFAVVDGARHHQHLRADAAAQDEGPRHVLHRLGGRGDRRRTCTRACWSSSSRRPIRARPTKWCSRCSRRPASRPASTSSSRSRPSASIRATRRSTRTTCRRSSAASTPDCVELAARALRHGDRDDRAGQLDRGSPRW